jgi:2-haloacid dehalogenase
VRLIVLDVNETLFGLGPVATAFASAGLDPAHLELWFARVLRDGFAVALAGGLATFPALARHHARVLAEQRGIVLSEDAVEEVVAGFSRVEPHADVPGGLQRARDAGVAVVALTNGTVGVTRGFLERAGLDHLVDRVVDVTTAGRWKPAPEPYREVLDTAAVSAADAAMVAAHPWDVHGAMAVGMAGGFVDRNDVTWPPFLDPPTVRGRGVDEVVGALLARGDA